MDRCPLRLFSYLEDTPSIINQVFLLMRGWFNATSSSLITHSFIFRGIRENQFKATVGSLISVVMKRLNRHWPFYVFHNTLVCDLAQGGVFGLSSFYPTGWRNYSNTLRLPLVSSDYLGQQRDGQLGRARPYTNIQLCIYMWCHVRWVFQTLGFYTGQERVRRVRWEGVLNDCKKATGRELSIFLLPRQICLHIFLLCLRCLLRQRTAIEIFWQAALCFHFHKRCSEGMRQRKRERGEGLLER